MTLSIVVTESIAAEPVKVYAGISGVERWPEWTPTVKSVQQVTGCGLAPGASFRVIQPRLPPAIWTISSVEPGRRFIWTTTNPGLKMVADHIVTPTEAGCEIRLILTYQGPLSGLAWMLSRRLSETYIRTEARSLKALCELQDQALHS